LVALLISCLVEIYVISDLSMHMHVWIFV